MSRSVSDTFRSAVYAQETDQVFLALITIDHPSFATPIRVSSDAVDTLSRGNTFSRYPFKLTLPGEGDGASSIAKITIDNVSRDILRQLRATSDAASVLIEIVLGSAPDTVEVSFPDFYLSEVDHDALTIQGTLSVEHFTAEPFPALVFSPAGFAGLF